MASLTSSRARDRVSRLLTVKVSPDGYIILTSLENRINNTSLSSSRLLYRKAFYVLKDRCPKTFTQVRVAHHAHTS
jgi:hypothetical protein